MKKKFLIPIIILFLIMSSIVIVSGLYVSDGLPENVAYSISRFLNKINNGNTQQPLPVDSGSVAVAKVKAAMPENINGVTIDLSQELQTDANTSSYGDFVSETVYNFNFYKNFLTDTVFITPDYTGKYDTFADSNGNKVDVLREYVNYSDAAGFTKVLMLNENMIYDEGALSFDHAQYYLSNYSFNAVLLCCETAFSAVTANECAAYFSENIRYSFGSSICFGIEIPAAVAVKGADGQIQSLLQSGNLDFIVIEGGAISDPAIPFGSVFTYWNSLAAGFPDIVFYCKHRNDLVCSNHAYWSNYTEICDQVRFLWDCEYISGSIYFNTAALKENKNTSSLRLSYLLYDGEYKDLVIDSINVNTASNSVVFTGKAAAGHKTMCNGTVISNSTVFTYTAPLSAGSNTFRFFSCGKSLTYRIYSNPRIIYSFAPTSDFSVLSNEEITVSAVCLSDASVQCSVNGNIYAMQRVSASQSADVPEGYSLFSCKMKFAAEGNADVDLGDMTITAALGDTSETVPTARITVMKTQHSGLFHNLIGYYSDLSESETDTEQFAYKDNISPLHDNGLGTALVCRIVNDATETLGVIGEKDTYHGDQSTLPAGTLDYITGMEISDAGYLRYNLASGLRVYGVNCELISNGYVMPNNRIIVNRVDDSAPDSTDLIFNVDWFSPVTVKCKPLKYWNGYSQYSYNISAFNAEYIEIKFYHAAEFYNSAALHFDEASVFSYSELYSAGDDNLILRLYLKKPGCFYGFRIYRNEQNQLVISCKKRQNGSLQGKVIMLDAGHGGLSMTGTAVTDNSVSEKTVTLMIATKAKDMLEAKGATVLMTRTMDTSLTLDERCVLLRKYNPDIFVSIHCDGTDTETDAGTHSFYFRPYSQPLADEINKALAAVYKTHIYAPTDTNYSKVDKSIKFYPFYVTRMNECPAVLVETGFMTNPVEGLILGNDNTQYWLAYGITNGIETYFAENS